MFSWRSKINIASAVITKQKPFYIQFYINGVCHLKCKQCNIVETNSGIGELSIAEIKVVARNIRKIGGAIVLLTGGEPFLRADIDQVASAFINEGLDVRLQTAGIATKEQIERCYNAGARDLNISLDSLDPSKQDFINSAPNSFYKAIDAIDRVSQVFKKGSAICSLGCVLSRLNYEEIPAILEFATRLGWYLSLVPVHIARSGEKLGFRSYDEIFKFQNSDFGKLEKVLAKILSMKKEGYLLFDSERFIMSSFSFLQNGTPTWRKNGVCDSPNLYFAVRPNGDFTTCCDYVLPKTHNLKETNFWRHYKEGALHRLSKPVVESCSGCHYGSYPEVTISVRDVPAFLERVKMTFSMQRTPLSDFPVGGIYSLLEQVKEKYLPLYDCEKWPSDFKETMSQWTNEEKRKLLIKQDNERRNREGRIRHARNSRITEASG